MTENDKKQIGVWLAHAANTPTNLMARDLVNTCELLVQKLETKEDMQIVLSACIAEIRHMDRKDN